jgi:hypothetical protein
VSDHSTISRARRAAVGALVLATSVVGLATGGAASPAGAAADDVHLNEIQVVGSHNSYHLAASAEESALRRQFIGDGDDLMQYTHAPLAPGGDDEDDPVAGVRRHADQASAADGLVVGVGVEADQRRHRR